MVMGCHMDYVSKFSETGNIGSSLVGHDRLQLMYIIFPSKHFVAMVMGCHMNCLEVFRARAYQQLVS